MVFPNFFITFVRHSFHTSHPCTSPSRERRHRPAPRLPPGTTLPSWHTRCLTRCTLQRGYAHALRILVLTAHSPSALPPLTRAMPHALLSLTAHTPPTLQPSQRAMPHALLSLTVHTPSTLQPPQRAMPRTRTRTKMPQCFPLQPPPF